MDTVKLKALKMFLVAVLTGMTIAVAVVIMMMVVVVMADVLAMNRVVVWWWCIW